MEPVVSIDLEDVFDGFDELSRAGRDLRPVWRELKPVLKADLRMHTEGPDGPWPPRAKTPRARRGRRRRRRRGPLLGRLKTAFQFEFDHKQLRAVNRIPWSGAHQTGAVVGKGVELPQREFAYASDEFIELMVKRILEHVTRRW